HAQAERKVQLQPRSADAGSLPRAPRWQHETQSGREPDGIVVVAEELAAIVDRRIADRRARADRRLEWKSVAQLVELTAEWPLLGERGQPFAAPVAPVVEDVLDDAGFLVVGLLD